MDVKILGGGCPKCKTLEEKVRSIAEKNHISIEVEKVTDTHEITEYGVMVTPGLVVDGEIKSAGTIPKDEDILKWLLNE